MPTEIELLQKIVENTAGDSSLRVAMVAGGSAVAGALASALLSYFGILHTIKAQIQIERQKLQVTVVTTERLRWLQELRSKVSAFYANIEMQISHLERRVNAADSAKYQELQDKISEEVMAHCYAIFPMLDKQKPDQLALHNALNSSLASVKDRFAEKSLEPLIIDITEFRNAKRSALDSLEMIGRKAWKKVQALE